MSGLNKYLSPITVAGKHLGKFKAYKMDNTSPDSNMRKDVGLGTCNCCDYFQFKSGKVWLIEETDLTRTYLDQMKNAHYSQLRQSVRKKLIEDRIRDENRLKVYGSMLVLCRLATKYDCVSEKLKDKPVIFHLIDSHVQPDDGLRFYDNFSSKISQDLKGLLSSQLVEDVEILNSIMMQEKLSD